MNGCPTSEQWVAYAAGELAPRLRRLCAAHLEVCPACRREVESLARGLAALETLPREPALRPEAIARLRGRLRAASAERPARPRVVRLLVRYGWAAAAALLIAAAIFWPSKPIEQPPVAVGNHHAEAIEEIAAAISLMELADNDTGSERLNRAPAGGSADELDLLLELDDAGLLLDYLSSQDRLRG